MKIYRVFLKRSDGGKIENLVMIKDGLDILALMFQNLYLFYNKMWSKAFLFSFLFILLGFVSVKCLMMYFVYLVLCSYIALRFVDWKSKQLIGEQYEFLGVFAGRTKKEAKERFLEEFNSNYKDNDKLEQKIF